MKLRIDPDRDALIVVDVQRDFCHKVVLPPLDFGFDVDGPDTIGGALEVPNGDAVVPLINTLLEEPFRAKVATQDWHPKNHVSFASTHGKEPFTMSVVSGVEMKLWPEHCLANSFGAEFHPNLHASRATHIIRKAYRRDDDAYSGFQNTGLAAMLKALGVSRVFICGLATDYCVKETALDAKQAGFAVVVLLGACRGVAENTTEDAKAEMEASGITLVETLE